MPTKSKTPSVLQPWELETLLSVFKVRLCAKLWHGPVADSPASPHLQDEEVPLDNISQSFQKAFPKADHFRAACAVCMLLEDNLLTAAQVRACAALSWRVCACPRARCSHRRATTL